MNEMCFHESYSLPRFFHCNHLIDIFSGYSLPYCVNAADSISKVYEFVLCSCLEYSFSNFDSNFTSDNIYLTSRHQSHSI